MKILYLWLIGSLFLLGACTAVTKTLPVERTSTWSATNPLSIPYEQRQSQFNKGNLVINHSFEHGTFSNAQQTPSFSLKGWETLGQSIHWIDQESVADASHPVPDGTHCIKIERPAVSEVSVADGIISDYIPVIPGNYSFSYHIRLEHVVNNRYRLGVKLFDAIAVKLLFFDRHKQPVDARSLNPVTGGMIDNSDKSYSFSNFWRIDSFPWGKVNGRSYNYPFSEGDIPDNARFVRLYFGLKGTGALWLDNVHFNYSKWNFTALERFTPFFDKPLSLKERLLPTPKRFRKISDIPYYQKDDPESRVPVIVIPKHPAPAERSAANVLGKRISQILSQNASPNRHTPKEVKILENDVFLQDGRAPRLIISIGNNNLVRRMGPDLPLLSIHGKHQGYIIKAEKAGNSHIVFLKGETPIGSYYAATTAIQLFEDDQFVYRNATIVDYPDFLQRSYVFKNWGNIEDLNRDLNALERMSLYKLNKVYFGDNRRKKTWYQPDDLYRKGLTAAGQLIKDRGVMNLALMVNPYSHFDMEAPAEALDHQMRYQWTHSNPESLKMLKDVYRIGLKAGANTIMLLADDFVPHYGSNPQNYSLYTTEDKNRFVNLQNAQAFIINKLRTWLDSDYPGTRIEFCPPWYSNEHIDRSDGKADVYLEELAFQIPKDVAIMWTGPTIRSLSIDMADLQRYRSLIGRWPMIWDNTLYARNIETKRYGGYTTHYPGKVRMCNLFEPYDIDVPGNFQRFNHNRQIYTNGNASSEIYKIKYATVADYEWNTAAYHPERSLWKILCKTYGNACARNLILFSDAYYRLYGICSKIESEGVTDQSQKNGKAIIADLNERLFEIANALSDRQPLAAELTKKGAKQKLRFEKLTETGTAPSAKKNSKSDRG